MAETYRLFGLTVVSEIALPELLPGEGAADVVVRRGALPFPDDQPGFAVREGGALVSVPTVARYWIEGGRAITVEAAEGASARNQRLFLLGSAFGALLHQRGTLPLHANAVEIGGRAVAFMGHRGAGKSTLAAWFGDRGHRILADDVCALSFGEDGTPIAHGGVPRFRLWREALAARGRGTERLEPSYDGADKFDVPAHEAATGGPLPLAAVYLLGQAVEARVERLRGAAAVTALVANTYRGEYVPLLGASRQHLEACLAVARAVPLFRAERRWGYHSFDAEARALEAHARGVVG